ncbi:MAG: glycosyltransferase [Planctomycetota bacterium]|jgi:ceramide glucosyltransferase
MTAFAVVALVVGAVAVLRQVVGLGMALRYVRRARLRSIPEGPTPPLSLIKPLYGDDPGLEQNLVATLRQNYPEFEVLFVHERADEPALAAADAAARAVPDVSVRKVLGRDADAANPKVAVLVRGEAEARHGILVAADADVRPDPLYLRDVANGLADADLVSFLPVFFGMRTFWARAVGLLLDTDSLLPLFVANGRVATGSTIGVRKEALERIGGYRAVADRIADDYALGVAVKRAGGRLVLARRPARLYMPGGGFGESTGWGVRWLRTVRSTVPAAYLALLFVALAPLLLLVCALTTPSHVPALWLLGAHTVGRALAATLIDLRFCRDGSLLRSLHLLPLLWFLEPAAAVAGAFGRTVLWRGRRYRLKSGRATLLHA